MLSIQKYLPQQYNVQFQVKPFWIGSIKKQDASRVIDLLKVNDVNFNNHSHLKRIRKKINSDQQVDVLLCSLELPQELQRIKLAMAEMIINICQQDLPISNPSTKQQYIQWSKLWPINFIQQDVYKQVKHNSKQLELIGCIVKQRKNQIVLFSQKNEILLTKEVKSECLEGTIQHQIMHLLEEWPQTEMYKSLPNAYYLTKLRLFLPFKICQMCSMALVHSRLQRIYFWKNQNIEKISEILCYSKLNHRVKIFKISENPQII